MADVHKWIEAARKSCGLEPHEFVELSRDEAQDLIDRAMTRYVEGVPRAWWQALKPPASVLAGLPADWLHKLPALVGTQDSSCWFVPESDDRALRVYRIAIERVGTIVDECPFFEYYVLGLDLSWLLVENDHNEVILSRSPGT